MKKSLLVIFALWLFVPILRAQEYRATLLGQVTDQSGASVPSADVRVTNADTKIVSSTLTNQDGTFAVPLLNPGVYSLTVSHAGFKTFERKQIDLEVSASVRINVSLEVGNVSSTMSVTATPPLLQTGSADHGMVLGSQVITQLPLNGENPYSLVDLAPGVTHTSSNMKFSRPFDYGAINDFSISGGPSSRNSLLVDGVPVDVYAGRSQNRVDVSYVPPSSATQQLKVQTATYDAQYGRTGGGIVSVSTKPGTSQFHGTAYEYMRRTGLNANTFVNDAKGVPIVSQKVDQYGFEIGGPIRKKSTFFMFAFERYSQVDPKPILGTVPTQAQRSGDFSQTFRPSGTMVTIYDPLTIQPNPAFDPSQKVSLSNLEYLEDPFSSNQIPTYRMDPVALNILNDFPLPNQAGDPVTGANNWFAGDNTTLNNYNSFTGRVDQNFSQKWRGFVRWYHTYRDGGITNGSGWNTDSCACSHSFRNSNGAVVNMVATLNPSTVFSATLGWTRYNQGIKLQDLSVDKLGFPSGLLGQMQLPHQYPYISFTDFLGTGLPLKYYSGVPSDTTTAEAVLMKLVGHHSFKFGGEFRLIHASNIGLTDGSGTYSFTTGWTSSNPNVTDANTGNAMASFLLGYPASANMGLNVTPYLTWHYPALFVQDNWQVNSRLTLNMGLRWDYESPPVERYDRQNRGFAFGTPSPLQVSGLNLTGGLQFAGVQGQPRGAFNPDRKGWQPRFGVAYRVLESRPLVFRAGFARYDMPSTDYGETTGFSQESQALTTLSTAQGPIPNITLSNPFPNGLVQPQGSSLGLLTSVGGPIQFAYQGRTTPYIWTWSAGFQYELPFRILVDASYVGSQARGMEVSRSLNFLTTDQLAMGSSVLNQSVPNPFYGVLPSDTTLGAKSTTSAGQLLLPYPQYTTVTENDYSNGKSWYNALQLRAQRRFNNGLSFLVSYTKSKTLNAIQYLNPQDVGPDRELAYFDIPHRLLISSVYDLPFGHGRPWVTQGLASQVVGGWQISATVDLHPGIPIVYPSGYYVTANPALSSGQDLTQWFDTSSSIWVAQPPNTLRTAPFYSPNVRQYPIHQMDGQITRTFTITERQRIQFKVSAYNLTNTPVFGAPNTNPKSSTFGQVSISQINNPRNIQIGFKYLF